MNFFDSYVSSKVKRKEDGWMETDNQAFQARKAAGFPIEWESVI